MVPFSVPCLELCIPFNCCKCTLYIRTDIKPERVLSGLFTAITEMQYTKIRDVYLQAPRKCICKSFQERMVLLGFFTDQNDRIPYPFIRGVARGSWGARDPPLVGLLLSKQPTIFRWRNRHDNILAVKAIVEKPTFLKFVFCKVFSSTALVLS